MNLNDQELLAAAVDRELKQLPPLTAPEGLIARVMVKIEASESPAARNVSWTSWPLRWRIVSLTVFAALFGAVCFAWQCFLRSAPSASVVRQFDQNISTLSVVWNTVSVLADAIAVALQKLGPRFLMLGAMLMASAYFVCIGLGTMMVRTALVRRKHL